MKLRIAAVFAALLLLAGCTVVPTVTDDGTPWSDEWMRVGTVMGVEAPGNGLELVENKDSLGSYGMFYASWAVGEGRSLSGAEQEDGSGERKYYDAQLYFIVRDCKSKSKAGKSVAEWLETAEDIYDISGNETVRCGGKDFIVLSYTVDSETNPYVSGASAFLVHDKYTVSAELSCLEGFQGDCFEMLTEFLEGLHYAP